MRFEDGGPGGVSSEGVDLGVFLVSNDCDMVTFFVQFSGPVLDALDERASRIDNFEVCLAGPLDYAGAGAVGSNQDGARMNFIEVIDETETLGFELGDYIGVVDDGAQATDRAAGLQGLSGEFDGATDAEAESGLFGLYDFDYEFFHDSLIWSRRLSRTFRSWAVKLR